MATMGEMYGERERQPLSEPERIPHDDETRGRSVGSLFGELIGETSALVRAEVTLARSEARDNLQDLKRGIASMATGGVVLLAGLLSLVAAVILALAQVMPDWLAAAIVGIVVAAIGMIMLAAGKRTAFEEGIKPERTLHSLGEMKDMARHETDRAARKWR